MINHITNISQRKTAIIVGVLFPIALFSDVLSVSISENKTLLILVMLLDIIHGAAIISIGVMLFPILKPHNKSLAFGYLVCRIIEGALYFFVSRIIEGAIYFFIYIFGIGALMLYIVLYQSKLVPRFISVWGLIAITILLVANSLGLLVQSLAMTIFVALTIILNELFLAIWLIVKGFNEDAIISAKTDINETNLNKNQQMRRN